MAHASPRYVIMRPLRPCAWVQVAAAQAQAAAAEQQAVGDAGGAASAAPPPKKAKLAKAAAGDGEEPTFELPPRLHEYT